MKTLRFFDWFEIAIWIILTGSWAVAAYKDDTPWIIPALCVYVTWLLYERADLTGQLKIEKDKNNGNY
jgi:hypothetical protein